MTTNPTLTELRAAVDANDELIAARIRDINATVAEDRRLEALDDQQAWEAQS